MNTSNDSTPSGEKTPFNRAEVVEALLSTLEMLIPHAARTVEDKTQALIKRISSLAVAAQQQENIISQMVACLQHLRVDNTDIRMDDLLNRTQVSLAFTIEHNLEFSRQAQQWAQEIDQSIDSLRKAAELLKEPHYAEAEAAIARTIQLTGAHLRQLQGIIAESEITPQERQLYRKDMQTVTQILQEQPARTRQMHSLLEEANSTARVIAEHASAIITAIQFQDYNTQVAENAMRLLRILRENVAVLPDSLNDKEAEKLFVDCREALTLGEIRHHFLQNLKQHPHIDRGYHDLEQGAIELF